MFYRIDSFSPARTIVHRIKKFFPITLNSRPWQCLQQNR